MPYQFIRYEKRRRVVYVTIDRPECLNALHAPASAEIREAFADFREDAEALVAVLTGSGERAFCAGDDLKYHAENRRPGEAYPDAARTPFGGITADFTCWKPIIAAINGYALGGGMELAMACDIIVAAEHAQLGLPEPRMGVAAGTGAVYFLPRHVPKKIAMGLLLTGRRISAKEAYRIGLVNEVVPSKELMDAAERWAGEILECAPLAVRATKQMAIEGLGMPLEQAMRQTYSEWERAKASDDYAEGPKAFAEKRRPVWRGS